VAGTYLQQIAHRAVGLLPSVLHPARTFYSWQPANQTEKQPESAATPPIVSEAVPRLPTSPIGNAETDSGPAREPPLLPAPATATVTTPRSSVLQPPMPHHDAAPSTDQPEPATPLEPRKRGLPGQEEAATKSSQRLHVPAIATPAVVEGGRWKPTLKKSFAQQSAGEAVSTGAAVDINPPATERPSRDAASVDRTAPPPSEWETRPRAPQLRRDPPPPDPLAIALAAAVRWTTSDEEAANTPATTISQSVPPAAAGPNVLPPPTRESLIPRRLQSAATQEVPAGRDSPHSAPTVTIGSIDVKILPPESAPVSAMPPSLSTETRAQPRAPLAPKLTPWFGLRQS